MIIVVGGGAAGLICALAAKRAGKEVIILEKNKKIGRKICITGKGRCNLTNIADKNNIMSAFSENKKFLMSALNSFSNQDLISFFENLGIETKVERGGRVFPVSDNALDIVDGFYKALEKEKIPLHTDTEAIELLIIDDQQKVFGIKTNKGDFKGAVVIATGGLSYPKTGSTGTGYRLAQSIGHKIISTFPSLVPLEVVERQRAKSLQGLSLKNVEASAFINKKKMASFFGEMVFTHYGLSGPIILSLSRLCVPALENKDLVEIKIDLKPALSSEQLDKSLLRLLDEHRQQNLNNLLEKRSLKKLIPILLELSNIDPYQKGYSVTKEQRKKLVSIFKEISFIINGHKGYEEAIVTRGGIDLKEINPKTMASKIIDNIYFCGEVLNIDGFTGGYNLQAAFSTGYVAGLYGEEV
ncbi:hypothetical protein AZF37_04840 [endosymbiont 'TC1' of Trimyema compressum]|uniref:NAD(P)/FAD-dependent oxidoreductase n=1 Tax=endosymbiont 'TC1' of Trimyema compressum TaxID=243899 RepID=UPI0007F14D1A|nr:NAD(P)/FAD-dependent oxidoreductase [endosymbiont 'TC1' of Trimyema compressum]AMP20588.1 hypothetical protein AZF37_04840 [endosymbiont 'TC1' of Trimyema compressum]